MLQLDASQQKHYQKLKDHVNQDLKTATLTQLQTQLSRGRRQNTEHNRSARCIEGDTKNSDNRNYMTSYMKKAKKKKRLEICER